RSPVKEKIEFIGSVLFIPCFFVDMGLLINIPAFIQTLSSVWLTVVIVVALISSKFIAALLAKLIYRYNNAEMLTMWSLSLPQVAATLAAALVAYQTLNPAGERLISEGVLNSVIVLMLVTSIMGPLITARFAALLQMPQTDFETENLSNWWENYEGQPLEETQNLFTVVVPIHNFKTQRYLIEMAALIAQHESGRVLPLAITKAHIHMDDPQLGISLEQNLKRLKLAKEISQEFNVNVSTAIRIDDDIALAISRTSREQNANLVVMGWSRTTGLRARLFGNIIDSVFWSSHCPVAVTRLVSSPKTIARIIVPIGDLRPQTISAWRFAEMLADVNKAEVVLLHVSNSKTPSNLVEQFTIQLSDIVAKSQLKVNTNIQIIIDDDVAKAIVREAQAFDLAVLRSVRYRTTGGLAVSQVTTQVISELTGSIVLLGEAHL
ncbi:universal stress protein, partial [Nodularia sphaerocarpa]